MSISRSPLEAQAELQKFTEKLYSQPITETVRHALEPGYVTRHIKACRDVHDFTDKSMLTKYLLWDAAFQASVVGEFVRVGIGAIWAYNLFT